MNAVALQHDNGVHVNCKFPAKKTGGAVGISPKYQDGGRSDWCILAGKVERFHSHDYDGLLVCGCEED